SLGWNRGGDSTPGGADREVIMPPPPSASGATDSRAYPPPPARTFDVEGRILGKKNVSADFVRLAILEAGATSSTAVHVPRDEGAILTPPDLPFLHVDAVVRFRGPVVVEEEGKDPPYLNATRCDLVRCAPSVMFVKEVLALPNYASYAAALGAADEGELRALVEGSTSRKAAANGVVEKLTGKRAKEPPRYRAGRVRRSDLEVLARKEAEGRGNNCGDGGDSDDDGAPAAAWELRPPRRSLLTRECEPEKDAMANLPEGTADKPSAHGKLTRSEYLLMKKSRQAMWFVERIRRLLSERGYGADGRPARFLDVGGGRGDLAVRIALSFPESRVVVVDSNESSVLAGHGYATKCGVDDRIEFLCTNFSEYVENYDGSDAVDFVVALHACGDLSDMALSFAESNRCDFVVCPCCYPKRYLAPFAPPWHVLCGGEEEIDSLTRMAELDDHREVSRRAMIVVNSMRRSAFSRQTVGLEEFDSEISKRNIALVGVGC
ncbi:hypothetical protein ACHAWF_001568, partial [Thalassiosira exigua]